ncbi:hypothetical protein K461DRAFT_297853 [Myriangium duriaei CBS 260.36]|uniref:DH domain-containing protein n=1 Tax=Myriangium duriaei CBS 260.36 TaxID=1168546 RepID=A0A9P4MC81_9PEZI|nr:hypothetical protein K461DRAFT_297853 [Myriangium duriaei CBS 260.36]
MPFEPIAAGRLPPTPEKHLNLSKQDAAYRPATVKQKVKQWQGDGGGVVETTTPQGKTPKTPTGAGKKESHTPKDKTPLPATTKPFDIVTDLKTGQHAIVKSRPPPKRTSPKTKVKTPVATFDPERKAWVRKRSSKPADHVTSEMKIATSPKKRVVSDSHWRKDRTGAPPKPPQDPRYISIDDVKPRKIIAQKSTPDFRPKPLDTKASPSIPWAVRKPAQEKSTWTTWNPAKDPVYQATVAPKRQRSRSRSRERRDDNSSVNVGHTSHKMNGASQKTPRKTSNRPSFGSASTARPVDVRRSPAAKHESTARKPQTPMSPSEADTEDPFSLASPIPDDSISRRGAPKTAPERLTRTDPRRDPSTRGASGAAPLFDRNGLVTKDRAKPDPPPKVSGNRIESWLGGQHDPFWTETASMIDDRSAPSPIPEPLRPKKREPKRQPSADREPLRSSTQNRQFSFEQGDEYSSPQTRKISPRDKENADRAQKYSPQPRSRMQSEEFRNAINMDSSEGIGLGINMRREFPSTGKPLSTIASVVTEQTKHMGKHMPSQVAGSYAASTISLTTIGGGGAAVPERKKSPSLKRRLTKHDDLMTVLSATGGAPSLVSARSFRVQKAKLDKITIEGTMKELVEEEARYQSELQTLVDGVIPALLSSVLSKSGSAKSPNLFDKDGNRAKVTQPIVDMGVALERLKSQHKRISQTNPAALLIWAQNAARIYDDYIKAWRMGFNDVVVNVPKDDKGGWHQGLARNAAGDLLSAKGDRIDVAFLLKRPLVRVKNLTTTFRAINYCKPSTDAEAISDRYHALVLAARKKSSDELARLEDEAANSIDPTRARDPRSLAPLAGVRIDQTRSVRARDYFEMNLRHTTGQQLDCAIEIFIRDNEANPDNGGDVLICEVSDAGRWLLFPPIVQDMVSARRGKSDFDLIMMIRGVSSDGSDWSELLTLHSSSEDAVDEWASMLADGPMPPSPSHTAFTMTPNLDPITPLEDLIPKPLTPRPRSVVSSPQPLSPARSEKPNVTFKSRTPSPKEVEIPIGEQARKTSKRWSFSIGGAAADLLNQATPGVFKRTSGQYPPVSMDNRRVSPNLPGQRSSRVDRPGDPYAYTDKAAAKDVSSRPALSRSTATRSSHTPTKSAPASPRSDFTASTVRDRSPIRPAAARRPSLSRSRPTGASSNTSRSSRSEYSVWMPSTSDHLSDEEAISDEESGYLPPRSPVRPTMHLRTASVPSTDMPTIPKLRRKELLAQTPRSAQNKADGSNLSSDVSRDAPSSAPGKLQKMAGGLKTAPKSDIKMSAETPTKPKSSFFSTPNFLKRNRRPSSPLKRQYTVSTKKGDSESEYSDSDISDDDSLSSHSSDEDEKYDTFDADKSPVVSPPLFPRKTPPQSLASFSGPSLGPSNSASQGPYRSVPQQASDTCTKTVANIFSWSDRGIWDPLHPVEVSVVVSPGLIEAFSMSEAALVPSKSEDGLEASPSRFGIKPLVALELTPLVPLRRGTALDISIRSPPTSNSQIASSSNVMFRSRSPEECEHLYNLINQARINNATYIALQNARPAEAMGTWAAQMDRRNAMRSASSNSWFGLGSRRGSTYRSNSVRKRTASTAASESSVGTMNTAFSALRRLSGSGPRLFSRKFDTSTNSESLSSGYATPNGVGGLGAEGTLGIKERKIRLYRREMGGKWRDMGSARLSIMAPSSGLSGTASPERPGSSPGPVGKGKRVLVRGTTKGEILLDVTLGESSFERVARTGIAVSVWRDNEGEGDVGRVKDTGGVGAGRMDVYMVQMKSERDAAYTFGLVGKLRY